VKNQIERRLVNTTAPADAVTEALARLPAGVAEVWFKKPLVAAAVLVPLIQRQDSLSVLLTRRTEHLHDHPGQISFPGGRIEADDADIVSAALREAQEEVGIAPDFVRVVGFLEPLAVVTGFAVTPVVGFIKPGFKLQLDAFEVAEAFEVPLPFLLDDTNLVISSRNVRGIDARLYEYRFEGRRIWGATAQMLKQLVDQLS
jgi:8-oxo-dGTP pyrophosphatase MutT (NUDIX family)